MRLLSKPSDQVDNLLQHKPVALPPTPEAGDEPMSISTFRNLELAQDDPVHGRGARRRYRAVKRADARRRQVSFDDDVARVAHEQSLREREAREVVRARRRHEHLRHGRLRIEVHVGNRSDPTAVAAEVARATRTAVQERRAGR